MAKVAIYCRLSDEDRNKLNSLDDSESIQNQKTILTRYSMEMGWDIYKIYSDDDYSGLDADRPKFNQMIKAAEAKKFDIILCKNQARFTRDMEFVEKYLHKKFIEWGVRFVGYSDNCDTYNKGNKKQRQIVGLANEWYCEEISENIRTVFDLKRKSGQFIGSFASYGYIKDGSNKNRLLIDENAANVVKMIYNWYLDGYGTQHIAFMLNEKGIPNPTKYKQDAGLNYKNSNANNDYGLWNKTTVKRILKNELYIGNMIQGKRKKINYKSKKIISTQKNEWVKVFNTHEAIIEKSMFDEVQKRIGNRQRSSREGQAHIFATKVRCADCGSILHRATRNDSKHLYSYLRCKLYTVGPNRNLCTSHSIRLDILQSIVTQKLKNCIGSYLSENSIANKLQAETAISERVRSMKNDIISIERQISNNSKVVKALYFDKVDGIINNEQFIELYNGILLENENLNRRKEDIGIRIKELDEKANNIDRWIEVVRKYKDFDVLTHTMVSEFIDYIEVGERNKKTEEQRIIIHWMF